MGDFDGDNVVNNNEGEKKEDMRMDSTFEKTVETLGNVAKVAANLTTNKPVTRFIPTTHNSDDSNNASTGNQNVNVIVGEDPKKPQRKFKETPPFKFPENRPLTEYECQMMLQQHQMDFNLQVEMQKHQIEMDNRMWEKRLQDEKKAQRKALIRNIVGGVLTTLGLGGLGWWAYTDYKAQTAQKPVQTPINAKKEA